jgi:CheY-like chemotaxis protein
MRKPGKILLVEDDLNDVELTLSALAENHLANEVFVVSDGEEALDYLYLQGGYESRADVTRPEATKGGRDGSAEAGKDRPNIEDDPGSNAHLLAGGARPR